jgi:hypothetical protein
LSIIDREKAPIKIADRSHLSMFENPCMPQTMAGWLARQRARCRVQQVRAHLLLFPACFWREGVAEWSQSSRRPTAAARRREGAVMSNIIPMPDRATDNPPNCAAEQLRRASADVTCACPFRGQPNGIELYDEDGFDDDDVFETSYYAACKHCGAGAKGRKPGACGGYVEPLGTGLVALPRPPHGWGRRTTHAVTILWRSGPESVARVSAACV